jgi:putative ATPase
MIEGGEDTIARRMLILSSEDIGMPTYRFFYYGWHFQAVSTIGYPESRIILSQCAIYLATSPKSNASIGTAQQLVKQTGVTCLFLFI